MKKWILGACALTMVFMGGLSSAFERGIYITQPTLETSKKLNYLMERSKKAGITTFVIDSEYPSKSYAGQIAVVKRNGFKYVARVVVFPHGGEKSQVQSEAYWEKKYRLVDMAINAGADEIQLDYIRYNTHRSPSHQNSEDIAKVVKWFKQRVAKQNVKMQVAVFGETSFKESPYIGQDVQLLSDHVDVISPMVYPSHYTPFVWHSAHPYETISESLSALKDQFDGPVPFRLIPYIETSNYHYPNLGGQARVAYIRKQIKAVEDEGAAGWYAWSPNNYYDYLFRALESGATADKAVEKTVQAAAETDDETEED
jgi:hypothetical protein